MRRFVYSRRWPALLCLATLALAGGAALGAATVGAPPCAAMAVPSPVVEHGSGHATEHSVQGCEPRPAPARIAGCASAPCCVLAQRTGEQGRDLAPAPPAPGVCTAAPETPTTAASLAAAVEHGTEPRPSPPSGRERLSLHATLLI